MTLAATSLDKLLDVLERIRFADMPADVIEKAKLCAADFSGVLCGSVNKKISKQLRRGLGDGMFSEPERLAMWLASSARTLDLDDGHRYAMAHPGVVINAVAAAVITAGGYTAQDGKALIEALVKGYETYCWQGRIINPGAYIKRGIDATCACGAAASAATASSLMGFTRRQTADAISLAASVAGGLNQSAIDGSAQKYLVAGFGAKIGIASAKIAACGLGGPARVFEGKLRFANAFTPTPDMDLLENPRLCWDIRDVYFKIHACVRRIHATLDAVRSIVSRSGLTDEEITSVEVGGGQFLCDAAKYRPQDAAQAQTSVPYTVAILLHYGKVEEELVEENISNEFIARLSEKVTVVRDEEIAALGEKDKSLWGAARVTIRTNDGREFTEKKIIPDGDKESPFSLETLREKFISHAEASMESGEAISLWDGFLTLEQNPSPSELFALMFDKFKKQTVNGD